MYDWMPERTQKKLTAEQVDIVIKAHEQGRLVRGGITNYGLHREILPFCGKQGCINQIVYDLGSFTLAVRENYDVANWFDSNYDRDWTSERFREELAKANLVEE